MFNNIKNKTDKTTMKNKITNKINPILLSLIIIEIIIFIFSCIRFINIRNNRIYLQYDYSNLVLNSGTADNERGLTHIDDSYDFNGYFAYTAPVFVRGGRYRITLEYNTDTNKNGIEMLNAGMSSYDKVHMDEIKLDSDSNSISFYIWVTEDIDKFQLATVYNGEGTFEVIRMSAYETLTGPVLDIFKLLIVSGIIDYIYLSYLAALKKQKLEEFKKTCYIAAFITGITLFASMPVLNGFLIKGSDMEFHMLRIEGIKEGLLSGQFPVRIQPVQLNGYGYPVSMFYGDIFLYPFAVMRIIGVPVQECYRCMVILLNFVNCLVMYICANVIFRNKKISLFAALMYTLVPYRINSLYIRAAIGEMTAYAFLPFIIYGLYLIYSSGMEENSRHDSKNDSETGSIKDRRKGNAGCIYAVAGFTGVINSHILTCEFVGVFTIIICVFLIRWTLKPQVFKQLLKTLVLTIFVNIFFLVPFIDMMSHGGIYILDKYTFTGQYIQGQGINLASLFDIFPSGNGIVYNNSIKEYGMYGMKGEEGMTIGLGLIAFIAASLISCFISNRSDKKNDKKRIFGIVCAVSAVAALYMSLNIFPWDRLEHIAGRMVSNIQFPWRILSIASAMGVFAAGVFIEKNIEPAYIKNLAYAAAVIAVISSGWSMHERVYENMAYYVYDKAGLDTSMTGSGSWNEYVPTDTKVELLNRKTAYSTDNVEILSYQKDYTNIVMKINSSDNANTENIYAERYAEVPLLYYRGYEAVTDAGDKLTCTAGKNNEVRVYIPSQYNGNIRISYKGMWYWKICDIMSLITIMGVIAVGIYKRK